MTMSVHLLLAVLALIFAVVATVPRPGWGYCLNVSVILLAINALVP